MKKVGFYSSTPVEMLITAVPGTIASRDIKEDIVSVVRAKVIDSKGNGVRNETVSFVITDVDNRTFPMSRVPEISNGTLTSTKGGTPIVATTDEEGIATIYFHPGAFTKDYDMATGSVAIQATWQGNNAATTVEFRNYPYLSVNVTVDPEVVKVNDSVTVTIQLIGDGYALQPDPIDVVLVIDRSGSMDYQLSTDDGSPTRIAAAKAAASTFIGQMNPDRDQIGLVSFSSSTTVDNELGDSFEAVNTNLNNLNANGATQLRRGIYEAIRMQNESTHDPDHDPDAIKAVVIMTDGEWNYDGSPIAHGTGYPEDSAWAYTFSGNELEPDNYRYYDGLGGTLQSDTKWYNPWPWGSGYDRSYNYCTDGEFTNQNMSRFASDNGVRLYTITFAYSPSDTVRDTMNLLATSTGGFYEHAQSGAGLTDVYKRIAGELKTEAGVNTTMDLEFGTVRVNSTPTSDVFEYEHLDPVSTRMIKYWTDNKTTIWGPVCENQGTDWQDDKILSFDVGDIYLNQTWETTFRLKVLKEGNIDIFGDGSVIRFNGTEGESEVGLPHTFITARLNLTETDVSAAQIELEWQSVDIPEDKPGVLTPYWNLSYTGNRSVTQKILYQFSPDDIFWSGTWHEADTLYHPPDTNINGTYSTTLNLGEKEGWYKIRVFAQEITPDDDGASDEITWNEPVEVGTSDRAYIRIS
ncbi:MAG TPA: VWA domain-containing protein [Methanoculleus sp.]|nr:VWA domain-containing protein [Methanoculleus sp.]